jgi:SAM-dependent methyltransferase
VNTQDPPQIRWTEEGTGRSALWRSEAGIAPPARVQVADDTLNADRAYRLACEGTAMLWRGDFQNARQLLQALVRRFDAPPKKGPKPGRKGMVAAKPAAAPLAPGEAFNRHRMLQAQRARTLGMLLIPVAADYTIPLRRAPDFAKSCIETWGPAGEVESVVSLRELLGLVSAHEWRRRGVEIPALGGRLHPHYGVFSPVRGEYVDLVARAILPPVPTAFDIGTGTGVLAALLSKRGIPRVVATDNEPRALACARDNMLRLGLSKKVSVVEADLFPEGMAGLVVCNPPWVPARPATSLEHAVYDFDSRMLRGFLAGVKDHLAPGGEAWLILSDLAEHLGLRTREQLLGWIEAGGLEVVERDDVRPTHAKASDKDDPLAAARGAEVTSLWRLKAR